MDKPASPERGRAQLLDDVRAEISESIEASELMSSEPDLGDIWHGEAFASLTSEEQQTLIAWAKEKGWPTPEPAPQIAHESESPTGSRSSDVRADVREETREEKRERPKTWLFREYRLAKSKDGDPIIEEDRKRWNEAKSQYDEQDIPTAIVVPEKLRDMIVRDSSAATELLLFCNDLRRTLDVGGVKVFIDRPKRSPGKIYAKWKYAIGDTKFQDQIRLADLPEEIVDLVRDDLQYYKNERWNAWYGPAMQQKREAVISAQLEKRYREEASGETHGETTPAEARKETKEESRVRDLIASRTELVAAQFERLLTLPADAEKFVDHVVGFTGSLFAHDFKQNLPHDALRAIVRDSLLRRYEARPDVVAAISAAMPEKIAAPPEAAKEVAEPAPESDEDVIAVKDEWLAPPLRGPARGGKPEPQHAKSAPTEPEARVDAARTSEKKIAESYASLRAEIAGLADTDALDAYVVTLESIAKSGRPDAAAGAKRLLSDIDHGLAGPLSEQRLTDYARPEEEAEFFATHPSLNARNFRVDEEGRVVAMVEHADEEASLRRAMRRVVDDAFSAHGIADAGVAERIAVYTVGIVTGRNQNEAMRKSFTEKLATLDTKNGELILKSLDELGLTLAGLAEQLQKAKKR